MSHVSSNSEVARILRAMAHLNGGIAVDVVEKNYPRFGPGDQRTGFRESRRTFPVQQVDDDEADIGMSESLQITLRGALPGQLPPDEVEDHLAGEIDAWQMSAKWDVRMHVEPDRDQTRYELTLLHDPYSP